MPDDNVTRAGDKGLEAWQDAEQKRTGKRPEPDHYVQKVLDEEFEAIYTEGTEQHADIYEGWVPKEEKDKLQAALKQLEQKAEQKVREVKQDYETKAEQDKKSYKEKDEHLSKREKNVEKRENSYEDELQKAAKAAGVEIRPSLMRDPADDPVKAIVGAIEAQQKKLAEQDQKVAKREEQLEAARGILHEVDMLYLRITGKNIEDLKGYSTYQKVTVVGVELKKYEDGLLQRATEVEKGEEENERKKGKLLDIGEALKQKKEQLEEAQAKIDSDRRAIGEERTRYDTDIKEFEKKLAIYDAGNLALGKERRLVEAEREKLTQEKADVAAGRAQLADYEQHKVELDKREAELKAAEEANKRKVKGLETMATKLQKKEEEFDEKEKRIGEQTDLLNLSYASMEQIVAKIRDFVGEVPEGDQDAYVTKFFEKVDGLAKYEERLKGQENDVNSLIEGVKARQAELDGREKAVTEVKGKLREANSALMDQVKTHAQKDKELKDREQALGPKETELATEEEKLKEEKGAMVERVKTLQKRKEEIAKREEELNSYEKAMIDGLKGIVGEQPDFPGYITALKNYFNDLDNQEEEIEKRERQVVPREAAVDDANKKLKEHELDVEKNLEDQRAELEQERVKLDADRKVLYQEMEEVRNVKAAQAAGTGTTQAKRSTAKAVKQKEPTKHVEPEETDRPAKILVMEEPEQAQGSAYEPHDEMVANQAEVKAYMESCGLVEGKDFNFKKGGIQGSITRIHLPTREATEAWKGYMTPPEEEAVEVMEEEPAPKAPKKVAKKPRGKK
jgi:uncharacterized protein (DUF3084 family)